jgi:murein DD-endopeptidase MepM/ murein hydrolase activator NlpD
MIRCLLLALALAHPLHAAQAATPPTPVVPDAAPVVVRTGPARLLAERMGDRQLLNFEWFLTNQGSRPLRLDAVELSAFDAAGALVARRGLNDNGVRPGIATIPERDIAPGATLTLFNPVSSFPAQPAIARIEAQFRFGDAEDRKAAPRWTRQQARIEHWRSPGRLRFPLRGRVWNYDGHDQFAHHRRFDYSFAPIAAYGFSSNFMRYADDFVPVDAQGRAHPEGRDTNADWVGFGAEVLAVADGVVVTADDAMADDRRFDESQLKARPMVLFGNHAVIDHGHGVHSVYAHLQQGSVGVRAGQRVRAGDVIGRIGASGSAFFPHLHFQLQDGPTLSAEGLPAYFDGLRDQAGARLPDAAVVETGRVVEAR